MGSYSINTFEDGDLVINQIDPDFPCGELEGITKEEVEDNWIEANFSGVSQEDLERTGIKVDFVPGESEYTINGEVVTKEQYQNYQDDDKHTNILMENTAANTTSLNSYEELGNDERTKVSIGNSIENPGHLEITIPHELVERLLTNDVKLTQEAADKLNSSLGTTLFNTAMGLKDAKELMGTLLDEGFKSMSAWLLIASMGLEPILDAVGLKDFLDADKSKQLKTIDELAKAGELGTVIASLFVAGTGGTGAIIIGVIAVLSLGADLIISDSNEQDLFQYDEGTNTLKWEVGLKNSDGATITYKGDKKINYEEPDKLYNRIAMYLETAKIDMNRTLNKLIQRREVIIKEVKEEINTEMEKPKETSKLKELAYIYDIFYVDYECKKVELNQVDSNQIIVTIEYTFNAPSMFIYKEKEWTAALKNTSEFIESDKYDPTKSYYKMLVLRTTKKNYAFDYESFSNNLINSYYEYYRNQDNNVDFKNDLINKITEDDIVHTGEVDLWEGLKKAISTEVNEEVEKNYTKFISVERIKLAQQMMNQLYSDIMVILEEYITLGDDFKELDSKISGQIKSAWE